MAIELKIPQVGESITEVEIGEWLKQPGDTVREDEILVLIETDKVTVELPAPASGTLTSITRQRGEAAQVGEVIGLLEEAEGGATPPPEAAAPAEEAATHMEAPAAAPAQAPAEAAPSPAPPPAAASPTSPPAESAPIVMPAARRLLAEHDLQPGEVTPSGPGGRLLKEDVSRHVVGMAEVVPMSPLRRRVAERLVAAQQTTAHLTTFNEIDMTEVIGLRRELGERFQAEHGVKLGFMSFFLKAAVDALRLVPEVNAEIRGTDIVYHRAMHIGIAVGGGKGLVVPVVRHAERLSFAELEHTVADLATRARDSKLLLEELQGGTFTISNGGIYGSMLSTPILNPPQSGVLGMHAIQERPVVREGQVVIRPVMYVALTYDHRLVDGREAVTFLRRIKECVEEPSRMLLEI